MHLVGRICATGLRLDSVPDLCLLSLIILTGHTLHRTAISTPSHYSGVFGPKTHTYATTLPIPPTGSQFCIRSKPSDRGWRCPSLSLRMVSCVCVAAEDRDHDEPVEAAVMGAVAVARTAYASGTAVRVATAEGAVRLEAVEVESDVASTQGRLPVCSESGVADAMARVNDVLAFSL